MSVIIQGSGGVTTNSGAVYNGIQGGTVVASTSGTSIDFTSIPSWVKRVTVMFNGVSTNGTSNWQVQLGAGSVTTSGYAGSSVDGPTLTGTTFTTGFGLRTAAAACLVHGHIIVTNISGNIWVCSGIATRSDQGVFINTAGTITLSGTLDRIRITTVNGTDTFDAGSINILYE
jgi:hypothetical protein